MHCVATTIYETKKENYSSSRTIRIYCRSNYKLQNFR